jgi:hypothetical protein
VVADELKDLEQPGLPGPRHGGSRGQVAEHVEFQEAVRGQRPQRDGECVFRPWNRGIIGDELLDPGDDPLN